MLAGVSLCISGFGATRASLVVLRDWFDFIGGIPGEVVIVDGGSRSTRRLHALASVAKARGARVRLDLAEPGSWETARDRGYIQEWKSGALATGDYLLFLKLDTLPLRRGHADWLERDAAILDDPGVFAVTNSHRLAEPRARRSLAGVRYLEDDFTSLNFALMKRERFLAAIDEQIGAFVRSGFRGEFPDAIHCATEHRRALIEWAWQGHARRHSLVSLARAESQDWMIFHINKSGLALSSIRRAMRAGRGIHLNFDRPHGLYRPPPRALSRAGRRLEGWARAIRRAIAGGR